MTNPYHEAKTYHSYQYVETKSNYQTCNNIGTFRHHQSQSTTSFTREEDVSSLDSRSEAELAKKIQDKLAQFALCTL